MAASEFETLRKGSQCSSWGKWADSARGAGARVGEQALRGGLEAIGRESCFSEDVMIDVAGHGLRVALRHLGLVAVVQVIWTETLQSHVWPPDVVPVLKSRAQECQVVESLDDRHTPQPLVLESLDHPLRDSDGSVLSYSSEARPDVPLFQQLGKGIAREHTGLVRDEMLWRPVSMDRPLQGFDDPSSIGSFQRKCTHHLTGEVVDGHQDMDGLQAPTQNLRSVDRPDVIRM